MLSEQAIVILVAIVSVAIVALIGGLMTETGNWYEGLRFPALRPPNRLFGTGLRRPDLAFIELLPFRLPILALVILIAGIRPLAALIISPYLAWMTFARWLNWRVVQLNQPFGKRRQAGP